MTLEFGDSICAIASPVGSAVRGIIRVSGDSICDALLAVFTPENEPRWRAAKLPEAHRGTALLDEQGTRIAVEAHLWPTKRSYTGEPMAELHLVGSPPILERLLSVLYRSGIRPARPGEFTLRAFLHGKLDLVQAEAVLGVIDADEVGELKLALQQLAGGVSHRLGNLRRDLLELLADLEAGLDFVDEDIEFVTRAELERRLTSAARLVSELADQQESRTTGEAGYRIVLAGLPNAGKSTLLNALAQRDVALVSDIPGTTRDYLATRVEWNQTPIELIDTAGWEVASEVAMTKAQSLRIEQIERADLVVWCSAANLQGADREEDERQANLCRKISRNLVAIETKGDLDLVPPTMSKTSVSALTGEGLPQLRETLVASLGSGQHSERQMIGSTSARCRDALDQVGDALLQARAALEHDFGDEILALELRRALDGLGRMLGVIYTDDILDRIFSKFCIGK